MSDLNTFNVNDCIKDGEAIIYQGLWARGHLFVGAYLICRGLEPTQPHSWLRACIIDFITSRRLLIFREISGKCPEILNFRKFYNLTADASGRYTAKDYYTLLLWKSAAGVESQYSNLMGTEKLV